MSSSRPLSAYAAKYALDSQKMSSALPPAMSVRRVLKYVG